MNKTKKNMILFLFGKLVSLFGTRIYAFAMSLYILKVTKSGLNFSISILLSTIPILIFGPIGGVIADRLDRKKMVLITDFLSGIVMLIAFVLSTIFGLQIWIIYMSTVLLSILNILFSTSFDASVPNLVDDENIGKINSYNHSIRSLSTIIGPVIGGAVYALVHPTMFILFNGISFILSTISEGFIDFYWKVGKNTIKTNNKKIEVFSEIKEGFTYIKTKPEIMVIIKSCLILNFLFTTTTVVIPHILVVQYPISERSFGIIQACLGIGSLLISILFANKMGKYKPIKIGLYTILLGILIIACSIPVIFTSLMSIQYFSPIYYGIISFAVGCIIVLINIPFEVYLQETTDNEYRGRVISLIVTIASAITPIGYLLHGLLLDYIETSFIIIYAGIGMFFIAAYIISKSNKLKKETNLIPQPAPVD